MTVSKKMNWAAALRTSAVRRPTPTRIRPRTETPSIAVENRVDYRLLEEIGAWMLLAGVSLLGWIVAAVAIGVV